MWFVAIGALLLVLRLVGVSPVNEWSWLVVLAPFAAAVLWWAWADKSGMTQRKAMKAMDKKREARREKALEALGQGSKHKRR